MSLTDKFKKIFSEEIIVLDGAMGTMVQTFNLSENDFRGELFKDHPCELKGLNDLLVLTRPDVISSIHRQFLEKGASVIETCSFNATSVSLEDYQMTEKVYEINLAAARLAAGVAEEHLKKNPHKKFAFVAGSIGPTTKTSSIAVDTNNPAARAITFDELVVSYKEQVNGLLDGGVDLFLVETVFDPLNAKAALYVLNEKFIETGERLPVFVSATVTESGRLLSGQTIEGFWNSIRHFGIDAFGLNCSLGGEQMLPFVREAARVAECPVICYPNAGLPNQFGKYDQTPDIMAGCIDLFLKEGLVNIVGGCCGTTPDHIEAISRAVKNKAPRKPSPHKQMMRLAGLEPFNVDGTVPFMEIGERANVMGSRKFARLIKEKNYEEALDIAKSQVENGASVIDINMDEGMLDAETEMVNFINLINSDPEVSKVPVMVDSSEWLVIEKGLKCLPGKGVVNSLSLKEGEKDFLTKASLVKKLGAALVVMAFDEKGQADTYERKVEIARRSYKLLTEEISFPPEDIIFDLNVFAVGTGMVEHSEYGNDFLKAVATVRKTLPYCHASGGLSNLSFSFRGNNPVREAMHAVFLDKAIPLGLDFAIVNPGKIPAVTDINPELKQLAEAVILNINGLEATEELIEKAASIKGGVVKQTAQDEAWREENVSERLQYALVKGISRHVEEDVQELLDSGLKALEIIETVLMSGMKRVGDLFGDGLMFLPQVIKSARVMRMAVDFLKPHLEKSDKQSAKAGKVLLATVKGDVHDIGKNIVDLVLSCNNFEVINLGEMVPCEQILKKAKEENVDIVGLSGLITPSLKEMETVAKEMEKQNFSIPLFVGGAATSKAHTSVKIAPNYQKGATVYCRDASETVTRASMILKENNSSFIDELNQEHENIREKHKKKEDSIDLLPIEKARKLKAPYNNYQPVEPSFLGAKSFLPIDLKELVKMIDWQYFLVEWGITGGTLENVLNDKVKGPEAKKIIEEGKLLLEKIINEDLLEARGVIGFYPAKSDGDDLIIYSDKTCEKILKRIPQLRQQTAGYKGCCFCITDWIADIKTNITDYIGLFTFTAGIKLQEEKEKSEDKFSGFMMQVMANRLAEAACEYYNDLVARELWGYSEDGSNPGIRPAPGYPATPDHRNKKDIFEIMDVTAKIDVSLTDKFMMVPESSVCGFFIAHPEAKYFGVGKIMNDQLSDYSERRKEKREENLNWLSTMVIDR